MQLDQLLKRHFWVVILGLTGAAAFLGAHGVTQLVGAGLGADEKQLAVAPMAQRTAPGVGSAGSHSTNADAILERNPFDSITGPLNKVLVPDVDASVEGPGPDLNDPYNAPECDGVKVLIIAASSDPDWSFAVFSTSGAGAAPAASSSSSGPKTVMRRRGGDVGGKQVKFIHWDRVWLTSPTQLCQTQMFKPPAPPSASTAAPPPPAASGGAPPVAAEISKGVVKKSATEFDVDRGVVDKILENQAELMRQARIIPEQENGKVVGIRLFGVRPDTLLGVLGMENGDRLEKINGFDMTSPEKALEAYARLRTADHLTISLNRRGQEMNIDYNIK